MKICSIATWCFSMVSGRVLGFHQRRSGSLSAPKMKAEKIDFISKHGTEEVVPWVTALVFNHCLKKHKFQLNGRGCSIYYLPWRESPMQCAPNQFSCGPSWTVCVLPAKGAGSWHILQPWGSHSQPRLEPDCTGVILNPWFMCHRWEVLCAVCQACSQPPVQLFTPASSEQFRGLSERVL